MLKQIATLAIVSGFALSASATLNPAAASEFTKDQTAAINKLIEDYIANNPQKLIDSLNKFQEEQYRKSQEDAKKALKDLMPELKSAKKAPIIGNKKGDFVIVEFFDYNCGYCKRMFPEVLAFVEKDGKTKWVLKELPTLSADSTTAAKYALAANEQGKYKQIHTAFMKHSGKLDEQAMKQYAKTAGLDMEKLQKDIESEKIAKILSDNRELATKAQITGIPTFVINDELIPGAFPATDLDTKASTARAAKAKAKANKAKDKSKAKKDKQGKEKDK